VPRGRNKQPRARSDASKKECGWFPRCRYTTTSLYLLPKKTGRARWNPAVSGNMLRPIRLVWTTSPSPPAQKEPGPSEGGMSRPRSKKRSKEKSFLSLVFRRSMPPIIPRRHFPIPIFLAWQRARQPADMRLVSRGADETRRVEVWQVRAANVASPVDAHWSFSIYQ
jgi:hypothetical protein